MNELGEKRDDRSWMAFLPELQVQAACGLPRRVLRFCRGCLGARITPAVASQLAGPSVPAVGLCGTGKGPDAGILAEGPSKEPRHAIYVTQLGSVGCVAVLSADELKVFSPAHIVACPLACLLLPLTWSRRPSWLSRTCA